MGHTAHATVRDRCFPVRVTALLLLLTLLLVAAMIAVLLGPLAAPARDD
jgi:hypothetical protein